MDNYYEILGLKAFSDIGDIKQMFRELAKRYHPDMQGTGNREKFERIQTAYENLKDDSLRKAHDQSLKYHMAQAKEAAERAQLREMDPLTKLEIILAWSTTRPSFRTSFANSCFNQLAEGRALSNRQLNALDRILISFQIDLESWLNEKIRDQALEKYFNLQGTCSTSENIHRVKSDKI
jgi:DnaJ-class molecular chaperone